MMFQKGKILKYASKKSNNNSNLSINVMKSKDFKMIHEIKYIQFIVFYTKK